MTYQPEAPPTESVPTWSAEPPPSPGASGVVVGAGVVLLVIAALLGLFGVLALLGGAVMGRLSDFTGPDSGLTADQIYILSTAGRTFVFVVAGVVLAIGLAHLVSGIGVVRRRSWGRIVGLVMSVLGVLLWALILVGTLVASGQPVSAEYLANRGLTLEEYQAIARTGWIVGVSLSGIALAAYTFVTVVLIRKGREFA
jgi:hypothetical protein